MTWREIYGFPLYVLSGVCLGSLVATQSRGRRLVTVIGPVTSPFWIVRVVVNAGSVIEQVADGDAVTQ